MRHDIDILRARSGRFAGAVGLIAAVCVAILQVASAQNVPATSGEWRTHGATNASTRYSPLDLINKSTVANLRIAWRQSAVPDELRKGRSVVPVPTNYQLTPIMVDGLLYIATGDGAFAALDPGSGRVVWSHVPRSVANPPAAPGRGGTPPNAGASGGASGEPRVILAGTSRSRGVAYWSDGRSTRIIGISGSALLALDAKTGRPIPGFGTNGEVDLRANYAAQYAWKGVPVIVRDVIVVGSDGLSTGNSEGVVAQPVRGFDVRTGKLLWTFNTIPAPGEFGSETWLNNSYVDAGAGSVWGGFSADEELGYVYLPIESAASVERISDFYGGKRPGANLFGNSLVCLDARTGKRIWHYQVIHHDIWDWDLGSPPILLDITVDGRPIKAVAQATKYSILWVFDRVTGQPVWPVEEKPVPAGDVPGEWYSPTQPIPSKPPRYDQLGVTVDDLIDFTPELRAEALKILEQYRYGPLFVPPSMANGPDGKQGTLQVPGTVSNVWNGASADPITGVVYVPSVHSGVVVEMVSSQGVPQQAIGGQAAGSRGRGARNDYQTRQFTGPRDRPGGNAIVGKWVEGPQGLPLFKPPYGRLVAIDLNKGDIKWTAANGDGPRDHPAIKHLNLPPLGQPGRAAPLVTRTLVFMGEGGNSSIPALPPGGGGKKFRAFDKDTGAVVWEMELPAGTTGAPMTYLHNGVQYIVVAVGWEGHGGELIALAANPQGR